MTQVELQHDIIAYMTEFLDISDLIAFEQTSMDIHTVICQYNIWKARFRRIWSDFNFALDPNIPMRLDASLLSHYKTESQAYASLIPSIQLLPQELDFEMTEFDIRSTSPARSTDDDINLYVSLSRVSPVLIHNSIALNRTLIRRIHGLIARESDTLNHLSMVARSERVEAPTCNRTMLSCTSWHTKRCTM